MTRSASIAFLSLAAAVSAQASRPDVTVETAERALAQDFARYAESTYSACVDAAVALQGAIEVLVVKPSPESLAKARAAWIAGREVYGTSEVLRFSGGPIDDRRVGVETFVNAWPVDESYIQRIIADTRTFPNLSGTILTLANERGGEANVSVGWHAVEFLLWGRDESVDGPGSRPSSDFVDADGAQRRREYLRICAQLLVEHLSKVRDAWHSRAKAGSGEAEKVYRDVFLTLKPRATTRKVLKGMVVLAGFEMSGERMAVSYETRDQEDEHSCFSDNTHRDFIANQAGIAALWSGLGRGMTGHGVKTLAECVDPESAAELDRLVKRATLAVAKLPAPYDTLLRAEDGSPERALMLAAIVALEEQAEALAALGLELGLEMSMTPGN